MTAPQWQLLRQLPSSVQGSIHQLVPLLALILFMSGPTTELHKTASGESLSLYIYFISISIMYLYIQYILLSIVFVYLLLLDHMVAVT